MKTRTCALLTVAAVMLSGLTYAAMQQTKVIDGVVIAASGTATSQPIDLETIKDHANNTKRATGYFSAEILIEGSGTAKVEFLGSNTGRNETYTEPTGMSDILAASTAGRYIVSFSPPAIKWGQIKATETVGSNTAKVSVWINRTGSDK